MYSRGITLGRGAHGVVYASVSPDGCEVAVKEYPNYADGIFALRSIHAIAGSLCALADEHITVPILSVMSAPPQLVMPVCTRPPDSWWPSVISLANALLSHGCAMSDIKPANLGVLDGRLVLLDVEAISETTGPFTGMGSYPVIIWDMWVSAGGADDISARLQSDRRANIALTRYSALATAAVMANAPCPLSARSIEFLDNPAATMMWAELQNDMDASPLFQEARARSACTL